MLQRLCVVLVLCIAFSVIPALAQTDVETETRPATVVDINSAPLEDIESVVLDNLLAMKIIEGRPYANKRQLLSRRLVSAEEYERIKDRIVARRLAPQ